MKPTFFKLVVISLFTFTVYCFVSVVISQSSALVSLTNIPALQEKYDHSAYNPQNQYWGNIEDNDLYTLAGYRYVTGVSPDAISFDTAPLVKYFYGAGVILFGNPALIQLLFFTLLLCFVYGLSYSVSHQAIISFIPVILLLYDPQFLAQMTSAYLDIPLALFIYTTLFFSIQSNPRVSEIVTGIFWGLASLAKSFVFGPLLAVTGLIFNRRRTLLAVAVFLVGYGLYWRDHSLLDFMMLHERIIRYQLSHIPEYPKAEVFRFITTGYWRTWFGNTLFLKVTEWWSLYNLGLFSQIVLTLGLKKFRYPRLINKLLVWSWIYLAFISLRLFFPRYLILILPAWYVFIAYIFLLLTHTKARILVK